MGRASTVRYDYLMSLDWTQGDLREGWCCFHSGAFFEAHEHWESVWLSAQEPEKTFLQGLIQIAAAFHHFQRGDCAGTISLLRSGLRRLDGFQETFGGIGVAPLRTSIRLWLEALETVPQSPPTASSAAPTRLMRIRRAMISRRGARTLQVIKDRATLKP
jgi:hypothetical protein